MLTIRTRCAIIFVLVIIVVALITLIVRDCTPEPDGHNTYLYERLLDDYPRLPVVTIKDRENILNKVESHKGCIIFNVYKDGNYLLATYIGNYEVIEGGELKFSKLDVHYIYPEKEFKIEAVLEVSDDGTEKWVDSYKESPLTENQRKVITSLLKREFREVYTFRNRVLVSTSDIKVKN
ncbi:hypothetical protein HN375_01945 [bacterium]|jgi:hypothetical protein|nr:hypothetical protein [bacterium]MBT3730266.1 hypothetical protein [bacterium]